MNVVCLVSKPIIGVSQSTKPLMDTDTLKSPLQTLDRFICTALMILKDMSSSCKSMAICRQICCDLDPSPNFTQTFPSPINTGYYAS